MKLLGSSILNQKHVISSLRKGWDKNFDLDTTLLLREHALSNQELESVLIKRQSLEPLTILPLKWDEQNFQVAHRDRLGRTETFYSFSRELPYSGSFALWKQQPFSGYASPFTARRSGSNLLFIEGYCTGAERAIINSVLAADVQLVRESLTFMKPVVDRYNDHLAIAAEGFIRRYPSQIQKLRNEIASQS